MDKFINKPIFILGNPRSGTTLLRLMLNNHPNIVIPPECGFIEWLYPKYKNWDILDDNSKVKSFLKDLAKTKKFETWHLDLEFISKYLSKYNPSTYQELCGLVYYSFGVENRKTDIIRWGDKNNYYITRLDVISQIYPNAQYILMVRDGRDVSASYKDLTKLETTSIYKPNLPNKIEDIAIEWIQNNKNVLDFFKQINYENKYIIYYENILKNPESELSSICNYLYLDYDKEMLNYYVDNLKYQIEPKETIDWKIKTFQKPDVSNIGKYRTQLTDSEINFFNDLANDLMKFFGYL